MKTTIGDVHKFQTRSLDLKKSTTKAEVINVVAQGQILLIDLFVLHFNAIPNTITLEYINAKKVMAWFITNYDNDITDNYYRASYKLHMSKHEDVSAYFFYMKT